MRAEDEKYIRDRIAAAEVINDPFPHVIVRDILPSDAYAELRQAFPKRRRIWLRSLFEQIKKFPKGTFWKKDPVGYSIADGNPANPYIGLIERLLHERFGVNAGWSSGQRLLFWRPSGWSIIPHTHSSAELLNAMIYYPTPDNTSEQGTFLYKSRDGRTIPGTDLHDEFDPNLIEPAGIVPYVPNLLIAWINSEKSIHGSVEIAGGAPREYLYFVSVKAQQQ